MLGEAGARSGVLQGAMRDDRGAKARALWSRSTRPRRDRCRARSTCAPGKPAEAGDAVRGYGTGAQILAALGIHDMILLTNTHHSPVALSRLRPGDRRGAADRRMRAELMATILLAEARFYPHLNDMLLAGARAAIEAAGHKHETMTVPGALELPGAIALAARSGRFCAFVALGVVIRGETYHFEIVAEESARGADGADAEGFAIGNGILTVENEAQAIVRADPGRATRAATPRAPRSRCTSCARIRALSRAELIGDPPVHFREHP